MHILIIPDRPEGPGKNGFPIDARVDTQAPALSMGFEEILSLRIGDQGGNTALNKDSALSENKPVERDYLDKNDDLNSRRMKEDTVPLERKEAARERVEKKNPEDQGKAAAPEEKREIRTEEAAGKERTPKNRVSDAGARAEIKKAGTPKLEDLSELLSSLAAGLTGLQKKDHPGPGINEKLQGIRDSIDEIGRHLRDGNDKKGAALLRSLLDRLSSLLEKIDGIKRSAPSAGILSTRQFLGELNNLAERIKKISAKAEKAGRDGATDTTAKTDAKAFSDLTVLQRPVAARNDLSDNGNHAQQGNHGMNFSIFRQGRGTDTSPAAPGTLKNPLFDEHLQQIVQQARVVVRDGRNGSFTMRLYPESLGRVNISLGLEQGTLSGRFLVDTPEVKQALLDHLNIVRDHLADAGVAVGDFQVNVRDGGERDAFNERREQPLFVKLAGTAAGSFEYAAATMHDGAIDVII